MKVLIAAGGTAGHINPALAIAGALKKADPTAEIHFAGRKEGMEYRLVTQAGYPFHHIEITGFQRKLSLNNIRRNLITLWNHQKIHHLCFHCRCCRHHGPWLHGVFALGGYLHSEHWLEYY